MSHDDWALAAPISARATRCRIVALVRCEMWRVVGVGRAVRVLLRCAHHVRSERTALRASRASFSEPGLCPAVHDRKSRVYLPLPLALELCAACGHPAARPPAAGPLGSDSALPVSLLAATPGHR